MHFNLPAYSVDQTSTSTASHIGRSNINQLRIGRVEFDQTRHRQSVFDACIASSQAGFLNFRPDKQYQTLLNKRIQRTATSEVDRLLLLEDEAGTLVALLWLELLTYPMGFDGDHDKEPWPELNGRFGAQIRNTWVQTHHRRQGFAQSLKQEAEDMAKNEQAAFLYTRCTKSNEKIIALNRKLGYEIIAEDGDFLRLRKLLKFGSGL